MLYPEISLSIAKNRINDIKETSANITVTACPGCKTSLSKANRETQGDLEVYDLAEILLKTL